MPIVTLVIGPNCNVPIAHLKIFCEEIIPAVLRTEKHKLNPGDVQIIPARHRDRQFITTDTLLKIEAERTSKRWKHRDRIANKVSSAWQGIFTKSSTVVALYLTLASYVSTKPVKMPAVKDMSLDAAVARAKVRIAYHGQDLMSPGVVSAMKPSERKILEGAGLKVAAPAS